MSSLTCVCVSLTWYYCQIYCSSTTTADVHSHNKWKLLAWKMPVQIPPPPCFASFLKIHFGDFESPCCLFTVSFSPFLSCLHVCVWVCSWLACSRNSRPIVGPVQPLEMLTPGKPHWGSSGWGKMAVILILWMCVYFCSSRAPAKRVSVAVSGCCLLGDGELQPPVESSASRSSKPMKTASFRSQCDSQLNTGRGQWGRHNPPVTRVSPPRSHTHTGAGLRNVILPTHSQEEQLHW